MPSQIPVLANILICSSCSNEFASNRRLPIRLDCGHNICHICLSVIKYCPVDQYKIGISANKVPINFAILESAEGDVKSDSESSIDSLSTPCKLKYKFKLELDDLYNNMENVNAKKKLTKKCKKNKTNNNNNNMKNNNNNNNNNNRKLSYSSELSNDNIDIIDDGKLNVAPILLRSLSSKEQRHYKLAVLCVQELSQEIKPHLTLLQCNNSNNKCNENNNINERSILSRPMQRKLLAIINCQLMEPSSCLRGLRAARSLGERCVTELLLQQQSSQQISGNLWTAVRARGCQFLGPVMQEEVLKLVLKLLADGSTLSRKNLVMHMVDILMPQYRQASKTSIGHVVQLLYRASCFKVAKRESESSLMQLKEEFRTYKTLRREHDAQIVQIAIEAGLHILPEQWSSLLYADSAHKAHMQTICGKLQLPFSFAQTLQELKSMLESSCEPISNWPDMEVALLHLAKIDPMRSDTPTWTEFVKALDAAYKLSTSFVQYMLELEHQRQNVTTDITAAAVESAPTTSNAASIVPANVTAVNINSNKYKVALCRDYLERGDCMRGKNCRFAHSDDEMDHYRQKRMDLNKNPAVNKLRKSNSKEAIQQQQQQQQQQKQQQINAARFTQIKQNLHTPIVNNMANGKSSPIFLQATCYQTPAQSQTQFYQHASKEHSTGISNDNSPQHNNEYNYYAASTMCSAAQQQISSMPDGNMQQQMPAFNANNMNPSTYMTADMYSSVQSPRQNFEPITPYVVGNNYNFIANNGQMQMPIPAPQQQQQPWWNSNNNTPTFAQGINTPAVSNMQLAYDIDNMNDVPAKTIINNCNAHAQDSINITNNNNNNNDNIRNHNNNWQDANQEYKALCEGVLASGLGVYGGFNQFNSLLNTDLFSSPDVKNELILNATQQRLRLQQQRQQQQLHKGTFEQQLQQQQQHITTETFLHHANKQSTTATATTITTAASPLNVLLSDNTYAERDKRFVRSDSIFNDDAASTYDANITSTANGGNKFGPICPMYKNVKTKNNKNNDNNYLNAIASINEDVTPKMTPCITPTPFRNYNENFNINLGLSSSSLHTLPAATSGVPLHNVNDTQSNTDYDTSTLYAQENWKNYLMHKAHAAAKIHSFETPSTNFYNSRYSNNTMNNPYVQNLPTEKIILKTMAYNFYTRNSNRSSNTITTTTAASSTTTLSGNNNNLNYNFSKPTNTAAPIDSNNHNINRNNNNHLYNFDADMSTKAWPFAQNERIKQTHT